MHREAWNICNLNCLGVFTNVSDAFLLFFCANVTCPLSGLQLLVCVDSLIVNAPVKLIAHVCFMLQCLLMLKLLKLQPCRGCVTLAFLQNF